ncbi:MAG TPA: gluconate 2-dehydrogenase subunit 3 family protein [Gemmatimonadales bacterium]|nr:gluconate 2-dehydrogenase subunit 3 family protein [Gemmatimonadales bacterium]
MSLIDRREAIRRVSALLGGFALVSETALLDACNRDRSAGRAAATTFTPNDVAFLDEVADTILPETSTPGAKAAQVGAFMALMVTDTYSDRDQQVFKNGLQQLDTACRQMHNTGFVAATPAQRLALLTQIDKDQKAYMDDRDARHAAGVDTAFENPPHYFRMIKELTLLGYFTSEIGYTKAMRYVEAPGRFDPCAPYKPGETAWAQHA